jgi:hypothetical protein
MRQRVPSPTESKSYFETFACHRIAHGQHASQALCEDPELLWAAEERLRHRAGERARNRTDRARAVDFARKLNRALRRPSQRSNQYATGCTGRRTCAVRTAVCGRHGPVDGRSPDRCRATAATGRVTVQRAVATADSRERAAGLMRNSVEFENESRPPRPSLSTLTATRDEPSRPSEVGQA